jgi:hypothetical protein
MNFLVFPYTVHTNNPIAKLVFLREQHRTTNYNQCFPHFYGPTFMTSSTVANTARSHSCLQWQIHCSLSKQECAHRKWWGGGNVSGLRRDSGFITFQLRLLYHCKLLSAECKLQGWHFVALASEENCNFLINV